MCEKNPLPREAVWQPPSGKPPRGTRQERVREKQRQKTLKKHARFQRSLEKLSAATVLVEVDLGQLEPGLFITVPPERQSVLASREALVNTIRRLDKALQAWDERTVLADAVGYRLSPPARETGNLPVGAHALPSPE